MERRITLNLHAYSGVTNDNSLALKYVSPGELKEKLDLLPFVTNMPTYYGENGEFEVISTYPYSLYVRDKVSSVEYYFTPIQKIDLRTLSAVDPPYAMWYDNGSLYTIVRNNRKRFVTRVRVYGGTEVYKIVPFREGLYSIEVDENYSGPPLNRAVSVEEVVTGGASAKRLKTCDVVDGVLALLFDTGWTFYTFEGIEKYNTGLSIGVRTTSHMFFFTGNGVYVKENRKEMENVFEGMMYATFQSLCRGSNSGYPEDGGVLSVKEALFLLGAVDDVDKLVKIL